MIKFRDSKFLKVFSFLMAISILMMSCDPNGDMLVNRSINEQTQEILDQYSSTMSEDDIQNFNATVDAMKAYVWKVRQSGVSPTQKEIFDFVYNYQVRNGLIADHKEGKGILGDVISSNVFMGDSKKILTNLQEMGKLSVNMANILHAFDSEFSKVNNHQEAFEVVEQFRSHNLITKLSDDEKYAFEQAMNTAEKDIFYSASNDEGLQSKGLCEECLWELNWVKVVIATVVTVAVWILAVVTLGLATPLATAVSVAAFAAVWVLNCFWVDCEEAGPCPEGQTPFCELGFILDLDEGLCELDINVYSGAIFASSNCVWVDKLSNGDCPGEAMSIPGASQCILMCFGNGTPEGFAQNSDGQYVYPYECK